MNIFTDDSDRARFRDDLIGLSKECGATIVSWCLMSNHFHSFISVGNAPLSTIMHRLLTSHAQIFNQRTNRKGHLFQGRHHQELCTDEAYAINVVRYIHQNPVRAGLTAKESDWRWSSAFGKPELDGLHPLQDFDPWPRRASEKPFLLRGPARNNIDLDDLAERLGFNPDFIRSRTKSHAAVVERREFALQATAGGASPTEIARWLGVSPSTLTSYRASNPKNP